MLQHGRPGGMALPLGLWWNRGMWHTVSEDGLGLDLGSGGLFYAR